MNFISPLIASSPNDLPYRHSECEVQLGKQLARTLGMPTANIYPDDLELTPGTYAGFSLIKGETDYRKALFYVPSDLEKEKDPQRTGLLEVHIMGIHPTTDLYQQDLVGIVLKKISDPVTWTTEEAMKTKINHDKLACLEALKTLSPAG